MFNDKIKWLGKGEKNDKKKIENIIFLILVLIITIILINTILGKSDKTSEEKNEQDNTYKELYYTKKYLKLIVFIPQTRSKTRSKYFQIHKNPYKKGINIILVELMGIAPMSKNSKIKERVWR